MLQRAFNKLAGELQEEGNTEEAEKLVAKAKEKAEQGGEGRHKWETVKQNGMRNEEAKQAHKRRRWVARALEAKRQLQAHGGGG